MLSKFVIYGIFFFSTLFLMQQYIFAEAEITTIIENKREKRANLQMKPPIESTGEMHQQREEVKTRFQEQREEFKQKMETIKDERKRKTVENIDSNINELNAKHTENLQKILSRVTEILDRIDDKVASVEAEGKDTSTIKTSSTNARTLISTAAEAIKTQSGKEYIINVTDETMLKDGVKKTFTAFRNDIKAVYEKVKAAREAVVQTARLYGQVVTQ